MEASRDDFVIAIRSAFLKKGNQQRFSLIFLIIFSIIIISLGRVNFKPIDYLKITLKEVIYRSSFIISMPENYTKTIYQAVKNHLVLYSEFSNMQNEIKKIKGEKQVSDYIIIENKRLKKIFDDVLVNSEETIARVLIDKQSPFLKTIVINKGSKDDVSLGMAVLDEEYLVGKVVEVNYLTSRILLLSDLNSKIPVTIEPDGYQAILAGTGKDFGIIQYSKENYIPNENGIVYTSGSGGIFKAGIPIGEIEIKKLNKEAKINFFSDFSQLRFVTTLSFKKE
jgi:rod shape-determining protein MreC